MKISQDLMFIKLSFSLPRQSRKVRAQSETVDPRRLKASASLFNGSAFKAIKSADAAARDSLLRYAINIPSAFSGTYVLPAGLTQQILDLCSQKRDERNVLVDRFLVQSYPQEREAARQALGEAFRDSDFPPADVLRTSFDMQWRIFTMEVPDDLPEAAKEAEIAKFRESMDNIFFECREAIRQTLADLVGHLADRLKPDADGTRKRLCKSTVENLRQFLDTVESRDITSDESVKELSRKARAVIGNWSADAMKSRSIGSRVQTGLEQIKGDIDGLIERDGARKIDLDLE